MDVNKSTSLTTAASVNIIPKAPPNNSEETKTVLGDNTCAPLKDEPPSTLPKHPPAEQAADANPLGYKRVKLSRSGQRRLGKLLKEGYNRDEAIAMVLAGEEQERQTQKRPRPVEQSLNPSINPPTPEQAVKRPRIGEETSASSTVVVKPSIFFGAVLKQRVVAVCSVDYPLNPLTVDQMQSCSLMIMERIIQNKKGMVKPAFSGSTYKVGYFSIVCNDDSTKDWLIKTIPMISPWVGAKLHAVDEKAMYHPLCAVAFIAKGAKYETPWIMDLLEGQNYNYNFQAWRVLRRINRGPNALLVWVIDKISADLLKIENNKLNFFYKAILVKFKTDDQTTVEKLTEEMMQQERRS